MPLRACVFVLSGWRSASPLLGCGVSDGHSGTRDTVGPGQGRAAAPAGPVGTGSYRLSYGAHSSSMWKVNSHQQEVGNDLICSWSVSVTHFLLTPIVNLHLRSCCSFFPDRNSMGLFFLRMYFCGDLWLTEFQGLKINLRVQWLGGV